MNWIATRTFTTDGAQRVELVSQDGGTQETIVVAAGDDWRAIAELAARATTPKPPEVYEFTT